MTELKSDALKAVNFAEAESVQTKCDFPAMRPETLRLSETRLAVYLLVSAAISFTVLRLVTNDEIVLVWGTLDLAIISMWIWAYISKIRLLSAFLKQTQSGSKPYGKST